MREQLIRLTYEVELHPGEQLHLPEPLLASIGPGRWRITVQQLRPRPTRSHAAFLESYAAEDEGLYDDCPPPHSFP
jgi:hypothetical protein